MQMIRFVLCLVFLTTIYLTSCSSGEEKEAYSVPTMMLDINLETDEWLFSFFGLPDGEAMLIQSGQGRTILVNSGGEESRQRLEHWLNVYDVDNIDTLIFTHPGIEYSSSADWFSDKYGVHTIFTSPSALSQLQSRYPHLSGQMSAIKTGDTFELGKRFMVHTLYDDPDDGALVLQFKYGNHSLMYMGTADETIERELAQTASIKSDFLKVGDFGTALGADSEFLEVVDPQAAVVFLKENDKVNKSLISRLKDAWIDVHKAGGSEAVSFMWNEDDYEWFTLDVDRS